MSRETKICRLCIDMCYESKSLYDENGRTNDMYDLVCNYLHPTALNLLEARHLTVMCEPCWLHVSDFHIFRESVKTAQLKLRGERATELSQGFGSNQKVNEAENELPGASHEYVENSPLTQPKLEIMDVAEDSECSLHEVEEQTRQNDQYHISRPSVSGGSNNSETMGKREYYRINDLLAQWMPIIKCPLCPETGSNLSELETHFGDKHATEEFHILCCDRKLSKRLHIKEHLLLHINPNAFKCRLCPKGYGTKKSLRRHVALRHPETQNLSFICTICNRGIKTKGGLKLHYTSLHNVEPPPDSDYEEERGLSPTDVRKLRRRKYRYMKQGKGKMSSNALRKGLGSQASSGSSSRGGRITRFTSSLNAGTAQNSGDVQTIKAIQTVENSETLRASETIEASQSLETSQTLEASQTLENCQTSEASHTVAVLDTLEASQKFQYPLNAEPNLELFKSAHPPEASSNNSNILDTSSPASVSMICSDVDQHNDTKAEANLQEPAIAIVKSETEFEGPGICVKSETIKDAEPNFLIQNVATLKYEITEIDDTHAGPDMIQLELSNESLSNSHDDTDVPNKTARKRRPSKYTCQHCDKVCSTQPAYNYHIWYNHRDEPKHSCPECPSTFRRKRDLLEHVASHQKRDLYGCAFCAFTCRKLNLMSRHRKTDHPQKVNKNFYRKINVASKSATRLQASP
uniref:C2H2-type domain-containing protein n=1 Tax=Stomoxys calcitrans TaxID=35570 RepID=A0A1I8PL34_STOCA